MNDLISLSKPCENENVRFIDSSFLLQRNTSIGSWFPEMNEKIEEKISNYCLKNDVNNEFLATIIIYFVKNKVEYMNKLNPKVWNSKLYEYLYWLSNCSSEINVMEYVLNKFQNFPKLEKCFSVEIYCLVKSLRPDLISIQDVLFNAVREGEDLLVENILDEYGDIEIDQNVYDKIRNKIDTTYETVLRSKTSTFSILSQKNPKFFNVIPDFSFYANKEVILIFINLGMGNKINPLFCKDYDFLFENRNEIYLKEYLEKLNYFGTSNFFSSLSITEIYKLHACCPEFNCDFKRMCEKVKGFGLKANQDELDIFELLISNKTNKEKNTLRRFIYKSQI